MQHFEQYKVFFLISVLNPLVLYIKITLTFHTSLHRPWHTHSDIISSCFHSYSTSSCRQNTCSRSVFCLQLVCWYCTAPQCRSVQAELLLLQLPWRNWNGASSLSRVCGRSSTLYLRDTWIKSEFYLKYVNFGHKFCR